MTFPTEPTQPLPTWATDSGAIKVDPGTTKRAEGWTYAGAGLQYGEAPPFPWVNNELYNNGTWATYFKNALTYVKAGNFDSNVIAQGYITATSGLNILGGHDLLFYNTANTYYTALTTSPLITQNFEYKLPATPPSSSGNKTLVCNNTGEMVWGGNREIYNKTARTLNGGNNDTIIFDTSIYTNTGSNHYNTSTGIFTAPVAGLYTFTVSMAVGSVPANVLNAKLVLNDFIVITSQFLNNVTGATCHLNGVLSLNLSVSQTVTVQFYSGSHPTNIGPDTANNEINDCQLSIQW